MVEKPQKESQSETLYRRIKRLEQTWSKWKSTPSSIAFLVKDMVIMVEAISRKAESNTGWSVPIIATSFEQCLEAVQTILEISKKHTSLFSRKVLNSNSICSMELLMTNTKIRLLLLEALMERREFQTSPTSMNQELSHFWNRSSSRTSYDEKVVLEPKTDSLLSFRCYSELVGREKTLLKLERELDGSDAILLTGLAGVGKTNVAAEFAMRFRSRSMDNRVFWVDCHSTTSFEASYRSIAKELNVPGVNDHQADIIGRTRRRLNSIAAGKWLIVLQNLSDSTLKADTPLGFPTAGSDHPSLSLADTLPESRDGQIIYISNNPNLIKDLPRSPNALDIATLDDSESGLLFGSKIPKDLNVTSDTLLLAKELNHLPLSIGNAAAYMAATRCDSTRYLSLLKAKLIVPESTEQSAVICDIPVCCCKATLLSFLQLQYHDQEAFDLLSLMAVLYRQNIPKALLWHAWKIGLSRMMSLPNLADFDPFNNIPSMLTVPNQDHSKYIEFTIALALLETYLLVQYDGQSESYSIHSVVQSSILCQLEQQKIISTWRSSATVLLSASIHILRQPDVFSSHQVSSLMLHILEAIQHHPTAVIPGLAKAQILYDLAVFKMSVGQSKTATTFLRYALRIQKGFLRPSDSRTLRTLLLLAESVSVSESSAASIPLYIQAIAGSKQGVGPGHHKTLFAQMNLCANYVISRDYTTAALVHYETSAAASASLQISSADRRRLQKKLAELKTRIALGQQRQGRNPSGATLAEEFQQHRGRASSLRQERKRLTMRAFSANSRVASLDSIVEMLEIDSKQA